jgi:[protein-PII] uridylyltransferase
MELIERRVEVRRDAATIELRKRGVSDETIDRYFQLMPRRYFTAHTPSQIARHASVVLDYEPEKLFTSAVRSFRGGFSEFIICTRDVHGLFSNVAGVLTAMHINILGAHVYTLRSGLALEIYRLTTPDGEEAERQIGWDRLRQTLDQVLRGEITIDELMKRRGRIRSSVRPPSAKPESVSITNEESDFYTIADVAANDRLGLLHDLTRVIADHGLEIYISKAGLVLDQVTDTFYLKDPQGKKVLDPEVLASLEADLLEAARGERDDA